VAITFRQARTVAVGDRVKSSDLIALANAVNDRLISGLGDGPYRLAYFWLNQFRQIRNPDDSGLLWPPQAEFHHVYQHLKPSDAQWPDAGPGDGEGCNVASVWPSFVFGAAAAGIYGEDQRVTDPGSGGVPLTLGATYTPQTAWEKWTLGKYQRGAFDPTSGALASPSFTAAREHYYLRQSITSPHGNAFGGFVPTPPTTGTDCAATADGIIRHEYTLTFTPLKDGLPTLTYLGFCPERAGDLIGIYYTPFDYILQNHAGAYSILSKSDYIEGPYTGGNTLQKTSGDGIQRAVNSWAAQFRGDINQQQDEETGKAPWMGNAFDAQAFLTAQYLLAPARGIEEKDGLGHSFVQPIYPQATLSGALTIAAGTRMTFAAEGSAHVVTSGTVAAAFAVLGQKLAGPVTVSLLSGTTVVGTATLTPDPTTNAGSATVRLASPPVAGESLSLRVDSGASFTEVSSTAGLVAEIAELYPYKPGGMDLYLVLRLAGALSSESNGTDGSGLCESQSRGLSDDYFGNCMVQNRRGELALPGSLGPINTNAVFDAARRLSKHLRILPRFHLVDYAVTGGKSVLWFRRYASGLSHETPADAFDGIGPSMSEVVSGYLQIGREYLVTGTTGSVVYGRLIYGPSQKFTTTTAGGATYEQSGDCKVYESNGIVTTAPQKGWSNEWLFGCSFTGYNPSDTSIWKPSAYSDYFATTTVERCNFYTPNVPTVASDITRHANINASGGGQYNSGSGPTWIAPELPTGYRYAETSLGLNRINCGGDPACEARRKSFYRSCRVFEPDVEVESVEEADQYGERRIKVTLKGRLHSTYGFALGAASSISAGPAGWNVADLQAEPFRSNENAIREYLVNQVLGNQCVNNGIQPGNAEIHSTVETLLDAPYGTCYPSFRFTQLVPKPYEDGNDTQQSTDTPFRVDQFSQMELYLRVMCEGYVDGVTSLQYGCDSGVNAVFDYTFPNLCYAAFKGRWFSMLAGTATKAIKAADVRDDNPEGFGPLPTVYAAAEAFNQYVSAINLLTQVRVMLPFKFQQSEGTSSVWLPAQFRNTDDSANISLGFGAVGFWHGSPLDAPSPSSYGAWTDASSAACSVSAAVDFPASGGTGDNIRTTRVTQKWQYEVTDPDAVEAIPLTWRDQLYTRSAALLTTTQQIENMTAKYQGGSGDGCGAVTNAYPSSMGYMVFTVAYNTTPGCTYGVSGSNPPPAVGQQTFNFYGGTTYPTSCNGGAGNVLSVTPVLPDALILDVPVVSQ